MFIEEVLLIKFGNKGRHFENIYPKNTFKKEVLSIYKLNFTSFFCIFSAKYSLIL